MGKKGIPVIVGSNNPMGRSGFSKHAQNRFVYPPKEAGIAVAHKSIIEQIRRWQPDILMPVFDQGWDIFHTYRDEYESLLKIVPNPGRELYFNLSNKSRLVDYALEAGVPIPQTLKAETIEEVHKLKKSLQYPVILKPHTGTAGAGICQVENAWQLSKILDQIQWVPLIQEPIHGEDLELTILCFHGEPIAGSAYLCIRKAPLPFGPPVACRSIKDDALMIIGCDFLKNIGFHGVAHLDFRRDRRDGIPKLLDFNVRVAGTNDISLQTGVDFGFMLYQLAVGEPVEPSFNYEIGREFRWFMPGELRHLIQTPHKFQTLGQWMKWRRVSTDFSLSDPLPQAAMLMDLFRRVYDSLR
ncbi:MAG: ATP-grasp domain-containing protein [Deltaproteobacteria bacterium]|nr:ATP-grasp domain-containing protein [Deltaproteobacteria bacterium]